MSYKNRDTKTTSDTDYLFTLNGNELEFQEVLVYWLPLMKDNKYNLISFQTTAYENNVKLEISPEPDNVLRIFMAYKALDKYIEIPEQELNTFNRSGFTVVEWGGTEVK